jgi:serine/threonine-protein kinase
MWTQRREAEGVHGGGIMSMAAVETSSRILFDPLPGTGYAALRRLGGGATSEVFEAVGPGRARCAVKVLRASFSDCPDAVCRLEREGRALGWLDHPGLVPVLDAGTTATGRPWFAMPLLQGETVKDRLLRSGPMDPAEACAIVGEALEALDVAHRAGVVHRDVKPANLFLTRPGPRAGVMLLDFGIAKLLAAPGRFTTDACIVGTPRYLAPEQILGGAVDARTDVYAAGMTLFEMIAGRAPFDASGPIDLMRAHLEETPRRLRDCAEVSAELDHAVARAVAKPPARRWPSARAFAAVLVRAERRERHRVAGRASTALEAAP